MTERNGQKLYNYRQLFTETYLSSASNGENGQMIDKNVYKAIKQNNVEYLLDKEHQGGVENTQLYDEQKQLLAIIVQIRKKHDLTKNKTTKLENNIANLQEQRELLKSQISKMQKEANLTTNNHNNIQSKHQYFQQSLESLEYMKDIRENMGERLKADILHYKKQCFDGNIVLIRLKTCLKQLVQKNNNKKHVQTKSKLILNTLKQTVEMRQTQRDNHLRSVQTMLMRKVQNSELKLTREHQIKQSMQKAMTQRLPEQNLLLQKLYCQIFLRKILRNKMNNLIERYKDVEHAFNTIKKQTKIANVAEFIEDYLERDKRYADLIHSIAKNEAIILEQKNQHQVIKKINGKLELQSYEIDQKYSTINHKQKQDGKLYKKLVCYNQGTIKCEQLKLMLLRWAKKSIGSLNPLTSNQKEHEPTSQVITKNISSLKSSLQNALKAIMKCISQNDNQIASPQKKPELHTQLSQQKITLRTLTDESVLTKQYSRKNFRVRTMTGHEQAPQEHDNQYDDLSEYDFLRHNRRIVKKNNIRSQRPRIKTKPF